MFIAPADQILLPLAIVDVSELRSERPTVPPTKPAASRPTSLVETVEARIAGLIPGAGRQPAGQPTR
jgi:hypothetical protein